MEMACGFHFSPSLLSLSVRKLPAPAAHSWVSKAPGGICSQRTAVDTHIYTYHRHVCISRYIYGCVCAQFCEVFQSLPQILGGKKGHLTLYLHPNNFNGGGQLSRHLPVTCMTLPALHSSAPRAALGGMWDPKAGKEGMKANGIAHGTPAWPH